MIELKNTMTHKGPDILVIGVGGGGNNAVNRMIETSNGEVSFAAINTDSQVLEDSKASQTLQIGQKLTHGYGAGADPTIGEAAANESSDEIEKLIEGKDLVIITCGLGGGTGTGAAPVIAQLCRNNDILSIGVVTLPFSFESTPRITTANAGVEKLKNLVDTLLIIPNDKLLSLADKSFDLDDAFTIADSVLKYTIEGITNIVFNKGSVNIDFNDLKATLKDKGIGHLGVGISNSNDNILDAVKQAIDSPLLTTSISGATNLLINASGKLIIHSLNEAMAYVREIAGNSVNIIWGTVKDTRLDDDKIAVTLIATGMSPDNKPADNLNIKIKKSNPQTKTIQITSPIQEQTHKTKIEVPDFLMKYNKVKN